MHQKDIGQSDDNKVNLLSKIVDSNDKRHNLLLELQGDPYSMVTLRTLILSQPMFTNFLTSSSNPNPSNSNKHFNIKTKMLKVANIIAISTQRNMGILFHCWTTYKWMDSHQMLAIIVTLFVVITIKEKTANVAFMISNKISHITSTIPHPELSIQCFLKTLLTFNN